jgi:hypothetical protein
MWIIIIIIIILMIVQTIYWLSISPYRKHIYTFKKQDLKQGVINLPFDQGKIYIYSNMIFDEKKAGLKSIKYLTPINQFLKQVWYVICMYIKQFFGNNVAILLRLLSPVFFLNQVFDYNNWYY